MAQLTLDLDDDLHEFVDGKAAGGNYRSASDYVVSQLSRVRRGGENLETMLLEGLDSGPPKPLDDAAWATMRHEVRQRLQR